MENQRLFIFIALVFLGMLLYQEWQRDYGTPAVQTASTSNTQAAQPGVTPAINSADVPTATAVDSDVPQAADAPKPATPTISGVDNKLNSAQRIHVRTDYLDVYLDTYGGDIREVNLRRYPVAQDKPNEPFQLMTDKGAKLYVAQSGFSMLKGKGPTHEAIFSTPKTKYALSEGEDQLQVDMTWTDNNGVKVTRTYTFYRGSHLINMTVKVDNQSSNDWQGSFYRQQQRTHFGQESGSIFMMNTYMGAVMYTPDELYEKIPFSDIQEEKLNRSSIQGGWNGMMQHYFVGAWVPPTDQLNTFYSNYKDYRYYIGMISPAETIIPGQSKTFSSQIYIGPKDQNILENIAPGLELTADYGFLTVIAKPLFWLLSALHSVFNNWGWAIIFLTLIIKLAFYKLSETSYKSMANMRRLQPRMKALKERHGDDRQAMNKSLMELYKKEKINPLGGCLPILVQIPVFIALYWVLLEAVELRQAPFMLWLQDLSAKDPYFVLPILMGITMFIQQRLNPAPLDPIQAKVMMALPLVFTVFFLFFPSGLVLYWVVNNSLSILQQWVITKRITEAK
jgi:YidC/Oxa1 family membrane protein insertase